MLAFKHETPSPMQMTFLIFAFVAKLAVHLDEVHFEVRRVSIVK